MSRILMITGASRGIGAACARAAGEAGYDLALNYRSERETAEALADEIRRRRTNRRVIAVQGDMAREEDVRRVFAETDAALGR